MIDVNANSIENALMLFALLALFAVLALGFLFIAVMRRRRSPLSFLDVIGRR